jgi:NAD(P)-dependent dehydrogenase (short-subunit alcohol dehydrogenase family)
VELLSAAKAIGKNVKALKGDVSNVDELDHKEDKSKLDIVFANARIAKYATLGEITEELYDSIFTINVKGILFTVQKALPLMPDGAAIILTSSIVGSKGLGANSVYAATKAVARSFARTWTTDLKHRRIRVNAISPGSIDTPGLNGLLASAPAGEQRRKLIYAATPLGRFGTADEVARVAVFLASDDASYITGAELFFDGGFAQV